LPALLLSLWWVGFAAVSFYWAFGGLWLVDTAVGEEGRQLARERPVWLIVLLLFTGLVKLLPVLFAYLVVAPIGRRIHRGLFLLAGFAAGVGAFGYGLLFSVPGLPLLAAGDMNFYRWMRLAVWMPQFWIGGLLLVLATAVFAYHTSGRRASAANGAVAS
jgi:hypothetical protein